MRKHSRPTCVLLMLALVALAAPGCMLGTDMHTTQISVQVRGDELLHMAILPRYLPDGERSAQQTGELLAEVARLAGGYTLIEQVQGGWVPPGAREVVTEQNDLLLVRGRPELAELLKARLHEEFRQEYPFVISLPLQSIAVVQASARGAHRPAPPSEPAEQ